ncbi:lipase member H-like [Lutzomyia longipalpis]|uniref:Lipase domain-containing protein n=2 Tax=Lutzomyia longipalpis TaxID=7200 RepID=A0A1B0CRT1_LUTLO|nr:lipase member H-like [Lutzomyia longipalpis]
MKNFWLLLSFFFTTAFGQNFSEEIHFIVFQENRPVNTSEFETKNPVDLGLCNPGDELAVIVHGWLESCSHEWLLDLVSNLTEVRGGCIVCMDYSRFSKNPDYFALVRQFPQILNVLYEQLNDYRRAGLDPSDTYMFGFSYGAHLCLQSAALLGERVVKEIDVCDPAGPGFPNMPDPLVSAENVQCIHTSNDKGTHKRNCHQNWNMGHCGWSQIAAGPYPKGSHGLCPYFYNSAFRNFFVAVSRPAACPATPRDCQEHPENFQMGYMERRKQKAFGTLYAASTRNYPYN